jgi:glutamate racemase
MSSVDTRPLGVFDSGVGGLTVLRALRERLPAESLVYLGDTARVPYGTKGAGVVTRYAQLNAAFLTSLDVKLLVVACNTASAVALPTLRSSLSIPVVGVIEPGAQRAAARTRSGVVGVLGTPGTIRSGAYQRALEAERPGLRVHAQACPLFVPLAEEGWLTGDVPLLVAQRYLEPLLGTGMDTLVLGCTHYPVLREVLQHVVGAGVTLVDSGDATAEAVARALQSGAARPSGPTPRSERFYVTDVPERFVAVSARFLGTAVPSAEQVDLPMV